MQMLKNLKSTLYGHMEHVRSCMFEIHQIVAILIEQNRLSKSLGSKFFPQLMQEGSGRIRCGMFVNFIPL